MLRDPHEIEIISQARQKNVRDPNRSRLPFERIFREFLPQTLNGTRLLDLGPGQFDFGELARQRGATVVGIDKDPAVCELGRHKGFEVHEASIERIEPDSFDGPFQGVFCKFSINALWFDDDQLHQRFITTLASLLEPGGWAWIGPWNGLPRDRLERDAAIVRSLEIQQLGFLRAGFWGVELSERLTTRYGLHGNTVNHPLYCRGLRRPWRLWRCRRLQAGRSADGSAPRK